MKIFVKQLIHNIRILYYKIINEIIGNYLMLKVEIKFGFYKLDRIFEKAYYFLWHKLQHIKWKIIFKLIKIKRALKTFIKNVYKNLAWLIIIIIMLISFFTYYIINNNIRDKQYEILQTNNINLVKRINKIQKDLNYEKKQRRVEVKLISEKVNNLHNFIKKLYPKYDYNYNGKIAQALENTEKIKDLPEELYNIYLEEKWIKPHGLHNYDKTLKNIIWPLEEKTSFVTTKNSEYGSYRPLKYFNYKHVAIDIKTPYNNSVYAIYDAVVWKKYFEESGGWTLEIKFKYEDPEGVYNWYFARFRHIDEIYVKKGDKIKKGDIIANMGNTGWLTTGKHLHFELWEWDKTQQKYISINPVQNSTFQNKIIETIRL